MLNYLNLNNTLFTINRLRKFVFAIFIIVLLIGLFEALILSPEDYKQSDSVRIMYVHVPSAWISLGIFSLISILSFGILIFKNKNFSLIAKSLAPSGFLFNIIALVTGSIWGRPTWGTWWAWDARLTSMLVLMFFYIAFIFSYKFVSNPDRSIKACTLISVLGLINIVIIKYSVEWWSTLHQPASISLTKETTVHFSMLIPLGLMVFALFMYVAVIFLMKYRIETIRIKRKGIRKL